MRRWPSLFYGPAMAIDSESLQGLAAFRVALRRFLAASEAISRSAKITPQQYQAMLAIRAWPGDAMTMTDLAEQLLLTHHAAVQMVNRLTKAGLAERLPSATDGRSVVLRLSDAGSALVDTLAAEHLKEMSRQGPSLGRALRRLRAFSADDA